MHTLHPHIFSQRDSDVVVREGVYTDVNGVVLGVEFSQFLLDVTLDVDVADAVDERS